MRIDFGKMEEHRVPGMNGGTGEMSARMYMGKTGKSSPPEFVRADPSAGTGTIPAMTSISSFPAKERQSAMGRKKSWRRASAISV